MDTYIYCLPPAGGRSAPKVINAPTAQSKVINAPPTASHKGGGGGKGRRERGGGRGAGL
jgi:hypothetical protein